MDKVQAAGVTVDRCRGCGAMWFDLKELERLREKKGMAGKLDAPPENRIREVLPGTLHCPRDHTRLISMTDRVQGHVEMMSCQTCGGILLDAGELRDLSEFTLGERLKSLFT